MSMGILLYHLIETLVIHTLDDGRINMVKLNVLALLEKRGKTKYWLWKQLGMSYQNFNRMVNNQTQSIRYDVIDALCQVLECTADDLFLFTEEL